MDDARDDRIQMLGRLGSNHARSLSEAPRRMRIGLKNNSGPGAFDKVVRSEPLARAPRSLELWVFNGGDRLKMGTSVECRVIKDGNFLVGLRLDSQREGLKSCQKLRNMGVRAHVE